MYGLFVFVAFFMSACVGGDSQRQVVMTDASQALPEKITYGLIDWRCLCHSLSNKARRLTT